MARTVWYVVTDGYTFSKHTTKASALLERNLNQLDGFSDMDGHKGKWHLKQIKGKSSVYGSPK